MQTLSIENYLQVQKMRIETHLDDLIIERQGHELSLYQAARYSILGGGKYIRPILTLAVVEMLGGEIEKALTPACAIEMIHAYSLIHDDLPCMDDDDYRRGRLTLHRQFNEGHAVLTGDYLLTFAFEIIAKAPLLTNDQKIALIDCLSTRSGGEGMIGGQVMDIGCVEKLEIEDLRKLHEKKTGALLTASLEFGAIIGNASPEIAHSLCEFGKKIGLTFQVVDDILDITASEAKHGNKTASDVKNRKSTFVTLLGLEGARFYAEQLFHESVELLKNIPCDTCCLAALADFIVHRNR